MKFNSLKIIALSIIFSTINTANAGVISYHTASGLKESNCNLMSTDYIDSNRTEIENVYGDVV